MMATVPTALGRACATWCARHGLTPAEAALVSAAVEGAANHVELAELAGVQRSTIKKQVQSICAKSGASSLKAAVIAVLREALSGTNTVPAWPNL
jgi:DNA-binding NarL/FixJ family response regulator